jgi:hypothetical protein
MEISHVISEVVLAGVGFFVFFAYLRKLKLIECLLWEAFVLSVAVAALLGAVRYMGHAEIIPAHTFFQQLASSVGVICLVVGAFILVLQKDLSKTAIYSIIGLGFVAMLIINLLGQYQAFKFIPQVCISLMMMIGFWALFKGLRTEGIFILLGTIFGILATFNKAIIQKIHAGAAEKDILNLSTDTYHYLLAIALLCYGLAAKKGIKLDTAL